MKRRTAACIIFFLMYMAVLHVSVSTAEKVPATKEYFENLDKESRLQDIVEVAGDYSIEVLKISQNVSRLLTHSVTEQINSLSAVEPEAPSVPLAC